MKVVASHKCIWDETVFIVVLSVPSVSDLICYCDKKQVKRSLWKYDHQVSLFECCGSWCVEMQGRHGASLSHMLLVLSWATE